MVSANAGLAKFQFALPHGERPGKIGAVVNIASVSIRAPAWGATPARHAEDARFYVSIRAPAWGATRFGKWVVAAGNVSIRAPAWGATRRQVVLPHRLGVSIRAPAWGATLPRAG